MGILLITCVCVSVLIGHTIIVSNIDMTYGVLKEFVL